MRDDLKGASRLLIGLCLVSLLAACGPLPRPFQPGGKAVTNETLSAPPAPETLSVSPVSGLLPEDGALAAELLAEELRRFNIAAAAAPGNSSSIYLDGRLTKDGLLWLISEVPFADARRGIAFRLEHFSHGRFVWMESTATARD